MEGVSSSVDFVAPAPRDGSVASLDTLAFSSQSVASAQNQQSTYQDFKDWFYEKIWGKPSCPTSRLYEESLQIATDMLFDQSKTTGFKGQSGKYNCDIKTHEDAVKYANKVLATAGDPFTRVLDRKKAAEMLKEVSGDVSLTGIGIQFVRQAGDTKSGAGAEPGLIGIVFPGSPADKAGLKSGDRIMAVDGKSTNGLNQNQVSKLLEGKENTRASIKVDRDGKMLDLYPTRSKFVLPSMVSDVVDGNVLYIRMFDFMNDKADQDIANAMRANPNAQAIIIDLRGNPGGRVEEVYETLPLFMNSGKLFDQDQRVPAFIGSKVETTSLSLTDKALKVTTTSGQSGDLPRNPNLAGNKPIVVLVDHYSASASEIFTGAIKDNGRAKIVGETTYGKGIGQNVYKIADGAMLTVTNTRYRTPNGTWAGDGSNNRIGIKPDIEVKQSPTYVPLSSKDLQFQKALETVKGMSPKRGALEIPQGLAMAF